MMEAALNLPVAGPADSEAIVHFPEGLPGLEDTKHCRILRQEDLDPILLLQDTDHSEVCLPVVLAKAMWPDYEVGIGDEDMELLGASESDLEQLLCLAVITFGTFGAESGEEPTASCNLFAPIVIHPGTRRAKQIMQLDSDYPSAMRVAASD